MLTIGIENGLEKGFTEEQLEWTNGFWLGTMCELFNAHGLIKQDPANWLWRCALAHQRYRQELPEFVDSNFVERMAEAGWTCNAGRNKNDAEFLGQLAYHLVLDELKQCSVKHEVGAYTLVDAVFRSEEYEEFMSEVDLSWIYDEI